MTSNTSLLRAAGFAALLASGMAQAQTPVTIGVMSDMSSVYSDIGGKGSVEAVRMAIEDFKAEATGLKVNIVSADPQNKPDIAATLARKWYDVDGVDMVIDLPTSAVSMAVGQIAQEKKQGGAVLGLRKFRHDGQGLHAEHDPLDLRHLGPVPRNP